MFHRSHRDTVSLRCGLTREHEDGPPGRELKKKTLVPNSFSSTNTEAGHFITHPPHLNKSGTTCVTLVRLFARVDASVGFEVGWSVELSSTYVAVIWLRPWNTRSAI